MCRPDDFPPYDTAYPSTTLDADDPPERGDVPMTKSYRFKVTFTPRDFGPVLDMLRYDGARVLDWDHATPPPPAQSATLGSGRGETFTVTLVTDRPPTEGRWQSFGLYVRDLDEVRR